MHRCWYALCAVCIYVVNLWKIIDMDCVNVLVLKVFAVSLLCVKAVQGKLGSMPVKFCGGGTQ